MSEPARELAEKESASPETFGRYVLYAPLARGGMATVYVARLVGDDGFSRLVAAKRLHPQYTENPDFVAMFRDEAHIASRIHHPNVVPVLDVVLVENEVILVQEYVHGVPLDRLMRAASKKGETIPANIAVAVVAGLLAGLHAAHETRDDAGAPLHIVHRDVSPQNVLVSVDGVPRLLDFGIAKTEAQAHVTRDGLLKGKVAYMSPEQIKNDAVSPGTDVYACGVVLWELLAQRRLHAGRTEVNIFAAVLRGELPTVTGALDDAMVPVDEARWRALLALEPVVARALAVDPKDRYASAAEMMHALLAACPAATPMELARWVKTMGRDHLAHRQEILAASDASRRSSSLRAATPTSSITPISGVQVASSAAIPPPPLSDAPSTVTLTTLELEARTRRGRLVPWAVAATFLLLSGILLGVLAGRREPQVIVATPASTGAALGHAPEATGATGASAPSPVEDEAAHPEAAAPTAVPKTRAFTFAPARPPPRVAPAPPPRAQAPAAAPAAPPPTAASANPECSPPFYFEGTKKLYKPGCI